MKQKIAIVLLVLMLLTLAACQRSPRGTTYQFIQKNDETVSLVINFDEKTIEAKDWPGSVTAYDSNGNVIGGTPQKEKDVYHYTFEDGDITITYPNGALYNETGALISWSDDYDPDRYIDGETLVRQLTQAYQYSGKNWDHVLIMGLVALVVIAVSIMDIMHPDIFYRVRYGLWVRNAEPTEFALTVSRICGVIAIVISVIGFLVVLFS